MKVEDKEAAAKLHKLADARREYATNANDVDATIINHEASVFDSVAKWLDGDVTWSDLVASYAPSWRWGELGA